MIKLSKAEKDKPHGITDDRWNQQLRCRDARRTDFKNPLSVTEGTSSGEGICQEVGLNVYTLTYIKLGHQQGAPVQPREVYSSTHCSNLYGQSIRIRGDMYVYIYLNQDDVHLQQTWYITCTPTRNTHKFDNWRKCLP